MQRLQLQFVLFFLIYSLSSISNLWSQDRIRIAIWGDSKDNHLGACENITDHLLHEDTDWDFQIHTGDFTDTATDSSWQKSLNYAGIDSVFVAGKFFMCTSNHDAVRDTYDKYTAGILPINSADSTTHFYHYQMGNVHLFACDAYFTNPTVMNDWLDQELATIPKDDWLIGFWHNPCYGDITYKDSYLDVCSPWLEKFYAHGGDFIIHGHAHTYVRSFAVITFLTLEENKAYIETIDVRKLINYGVIDEWTWDRTTNVAQKTTPLVETYSLKQCYPNPFNPSTKINYGLPKSGHVRLTVHNVMGREIRTLVNENQNAGFYTYKFEAVDQNGYILPSGMYFYRIQSGFFVQTKKMLLMR